MSEPNLRGEIDLDAVQAGFAGYRNGRYRIERLIGQGGMGSVFLGRDTTWDDSPCAIKVVHPAMLGDPTSVARFMAEARTMRAIDHPNVVKVYDLDELPSGLPFIILEWVDGGSLWDFVETNGGPLSAEMALNVMILSCLGVEAAHARGVIHRDIKPDNILLDRQGNPKVADFGIALRDTGKTRLTQAHIGMGSWGYMSLEQAEMAKDVDVRTDVHSLGVTLWALLRGEHPPERIIFGFWIEGSPEKLEGIPDGLRPIIIKSTAVRREDRYASVAEFRQALESSQDFVAAITRSPTVQYVPSGVLPVPQRPSIHGVVGDAGDSTLAVPASMGDVQLPVDTMHDGVGPFVARKPSVRRPVLIGAMIAVVGITLALLAWWNSTREHSVSTVAEVQEVPIVAKPIPAPPAPTLVPVSVPIPAPVPVPPAPTKPLEVVPRRTAEEMADRAERIGIEAEKPIEPIVAEAKVKPLKRIKPTKPIPEPPAGNTVVEVPKVPEPVPIVIENARVSVSFPEGDPIKVWLVGPSGGKHTVPSSVPPGTYKVIGAFPSGERIAIPTLIIQAGKSVRLSCIPQVVKCQAR